MNKLKEFLYQHTVEITLFVMGLMIVFFAVFGK